MNAARELADAALNANQFALAHVTDDEFGAITKALSYIKQDLNNLISTVNDMQYGHATVDESQTERLITEAAGEDA
ncbi:hypothetical protein [Kitasatospora purpeofusca]|uniref:hypothetical protein n=1 Tax=Kitasatospora purpeofusca TaxID=67352 RepID=UPI0036D27513